MAPKQTACACESVNADAVKRAKAREEDIARLLAMAEHFKVFSDPSRLRILMALESGELCVCDLSAALEMSQSAISHQLAMLRRARLVRTRREGKSIHYSLDDDHVGQTIAIAREHLTERRGA